MMRTGIYWERGLETPRPADDELIEFDPQLVPAMLSAILGRMGSSHWTTQAAYLEGYSRLSWQGALLLMGAKEDIIIELRATRDGEAGHAPYDLETHPVGEWPGPSLRTLSNQLYAEPDTAAELLVQIRDLLAASGEGSAEQLELLGQIVLLLGA